jgi:SAM-dependent methyltransferase
MPICPECRAGQVSLEAPVCEACGWRGETAAGVPDFTSRRDRDEGVLTAYTELYERIAADDLESPIQEQELLALEAERLVETLGSVAGEAVCDIGIGRGLLLERLGAEQPRLLVGVDLSVTYLRRARNGVANLRLVRANAENLPFREEFDAIVASDVFEHVLNPADFLASVVDALVPGGRLVMKVPFRENMSQYRRSSGCPYPMVHLRTFDRTLLRQALEDAGLEVKLFRYSGFYAGRWQPFLRRWPRGTRILQRLLERRYGPNPGPNRIHPRVGRLLMRPVVIIAVAVKPQKGDAR